MCVRSELIYTEFVLYFEQRMLLLMIHWNVSGFFFSDVKQFPWKVENHLNEPIK